MTFDASSLEFWETIADVGTVLVMVGVTGEGLDIVLKICKRKVKNARFHNWLEKHDFAIEIWGAIFWIMVVVGLAIEFKGNHKAQQIVTVENTRMRQKAGDAIALAGMVSVQAASTSNNVAKMNPTNQPVRSITATVRLYMNWHNPPTPPPREINLSAMLLVSGQMPSITLRGYHATLLKSAAYDIQFSDPSISIDETGYALLKGWNTLKLQFVEFEKTNVQIEYGLADIKVNEFQKRFSIGQGAIRDGFSSISGSSGTNDVEVLTEK